MNTTKPAIVMQTDFTKDISVCTMQGVCKMVDPELEVFDNTHDIRSFDTYHASISLDFVVDFWPEGTIFVSVVDPGVGTDRRACVAKLKNGCYVVTPDNGSLTHVKQRVGIEEIRVIDEERNRLKKTEKCNIFHGRDLFAYCGARLAAGIISYEEVGEEYSLDEIVEHRLIPYAVKDGKITGMIDSADFHFGLVCSNVPAEAFEAQSISYGDVVRVLIRNQSTGQVSYEGNVPFCPSFGSVEVGEPLLMISETIQIQIAVNCNNMTKLYDLGIGPDWYIEFEKVNTKG